MVLVVVTKYVFKPVVSLCSRYRMDSTMVVVGTVSAAMILKLNTRNSDVEPVHRFE